MKRHIYTLFVLVSIFSCNSKSNKLIQEIEECNNYMISRYTRSKYLDKQISFYEAMKDFETIFMRSSILQNNSKAGYKKMISDLDTKLISDSALRSIQKQLNQSAKKNKLDSLIKELPMLLYDCFKGAIYNNKQLENTAINRQKASIKDALIHQGSYYPKEAIYPLIDAVEDKDFEQEIIYRSAILVLLYDNLEELVHPTQPSYRDKN